MKLKTKTVFIDTSIFVSENYLLGNKIKQLGQFSLDEVIDLKITDITYEELKKRVIHDVNMTKSLFKRAHNNFHGNGKILKNLEEFRSYYPMPIIDVEATSNKIIKQLDTFIEKYRIEIVNKFMSDIESVFKQYFLSELPFGDGQKKDEFPDAFVLSTIEGWSEKNKQLCYVLSIDKDISKYKSPTKRLIPCSDLAKMIDAIFNYLENEKYLFIDKNALIQFDEIRQILERDYEERIALVVYDDLIDDYEKEELEFDPAEIGTISLLRHSVIDIEGDFASVQFEVCIDFEMFLSFEDLSSAIYDKEDGVWWGVERVSEDKNFSSIFEFVAHFYYDVKEDNFEFDRIEDFTLIEYNEV